MSSARVTLTLDLAQHELLLSLITDALLSAATDDQYDEFRQVRFGELVLLRKACYYDFVAGLLAKRPG